MSKLKQILLNIACLPSSDQRWILRRLSDKQRATLEQKHGLKLLHSAQRFRKLKTKNPGLPLASPEPIPSYCQKLATKAPLYIAVVIEQGSYPWQALFLQQFDKDGVIKSSLETHVPDIKTLVKEALFSEWENSISFDAYLESGHG